MLVFTVSLFILHFFRFPLDATILETQVRIINLESTRAQTILYMTLFCSFAVICALTLLFPGVRIIPYKIYSDALIIAIVVIMAIVLGSWSRQFLLGLLFVAGGLTFLRTCWPIIDYGLWVKFAPGRIKLIDRLIFWMMIGGVGCYIIFFMLLPLSVPLLIHSATELRGIEGHYAVTALPGFDLVCCSGEQKVKHINYGAAMPLLTAASLKLFSFFGMSETDLVRTVKLNQVIAGVLICVLGYLTNKKYYPYVIALLLGLTAFTLSNVGIAVGYPNQSGIRYIPALAALIVLVLELRRLKPRIWLLALAAALVVIMNPETGIATTVGYVVAVILKNYIPQAPIASTSKTLAQFMVIFLIGLIIGSNLILGMILDNASGGLFQFLMLFTVGGYGGMVDKPSTVASLILLLTITIVLRSVWRAREGTLLSTDIYEGAIGSIMLVWLMYYVNRMAEWNLWFELVLLVLIIAPRLAYDNSYLLFQRSAQSGGLSMVVTCLIGGLVTSSVAQFMPMAKEGIRWQRVGCNKEENFDGKCLPWLKGTNFDSQMKALTEKYSRADTLVLSGISTYARLRGFNEEFPWYDPMEVVRKKDVHTIVGWINSHGPKFVVIDDPDYEIALASPEHSNQIQSYVPHLSSYYEKSKESGWILLERI